jgi:hypothetical protein
MLSTKNYVDRPKTNSAIALTKIILKICTFFIKKQWFYKEKTIDKSVHILRITHFSETTKDRNLIFGMSGDANVKLCIQHFLSPGLSPNLLVFNLPSHPDHKYIWLGVGISVTFFKTDSPAGGAEPPG